MKKIGASFVVFMLCTCFTMHTFAADEVIVGGPTSFWAVPGRSAEIIYVKSPANTGEGIRFYIEGTNGATYTTQIQIWGRKGSSMGWVDIGGTGKTFTGDSVTGFSGNGDKYRLLITTDTAVSGKVTVKRWVIW